MALRIQITKFKFCQYLLRVNSPNFPVIQYLNRISSVQAFPCELHYITLHIIAVIGAIFYRKSPTPQMLNFHMINAVAEHTCTVTIIYVESAYEIEQKICSV